MGNKSQSDRVYLNLADAAKFPVTDEVLLGVM